MSKLPHIEDVAAFRTDDPPSGAPPESWDVAAHAELYDTEELGGPAPVGALAPIDGFDALPYGDYRLATYTVPGTAVRLSLRIDVAPIFLALMTAWDSKVERLGPAQVWGHAYRPVRGSTATSFHACGIAVDLNAELHPLAEHPTFTPAQVAAARTLMGRWGGRDIFRWGYDYDGRKDDMHVELMLPRPDAVNLATAIITPPHGWSPTFPYAAGDHNHGVLTLQRMLTRHGYPNLTCDGWFGPATVAAVRHFQLVSKLPVDGIVGAATWAALDR